MTRPTLPLVLFLTLVLFLGAGCRKSADTPTTIKTTWDTTWETAATQAKASGKPILIAFTREDVSPWSARLKTEILETDQFSTWAAQNVVPLRVDLSKQADPSPEASAANQKLAEKYGVMGYPTVVFADAEGKPLGSLRYQSGGPGPWLEQAGEVLAGKGPASLPWLHLWEEASKESKASGKPILMDFTGSDWCVFCIKLKKEVFDTDAFREWSAAKVVLMEVDFPRNFDLDPRLLTQNEELAGQYGVRGFPTIVFADHEGKPIGSLGYSEGGPDVWLKKAAAALAGKPAE